MYLLLWVLEQGGEFDMRPVVNFLNKDYSVHPSLWKQAVKEFCQSENSKREMMRRLESSLDVQKELTHIKDQFKDLKELRSQMMELVEVKAEIFFFFKKEDQFPLLLKEGLPFQVFSKPGFDLF